MEQESSNDIHKRLSGVESRLGFLELVVGNLSATTPSSAGAPPPPALSVAPPTPWNPPSPGVISRPKPRKSTELEIGQKWLSVAGVVLLFLGTLFFVSYVFRFVGPAGKVGLSYAVAVALFVVSTATRKKYLFFSGIVAAGAWSVAYLTTYAMHFFAATRIITSPTVELVLLLVVVAALFLVALTQRSRPLVALGLILGFLTMILSPLSLFSVIGTVLMAIVAVALVITLPWGDLLLPASIGAFVSYYVWFADVVVRFPAQGGGLIEKNTIGLVAVMCLWATAAVGIVLRRDPAKSFSGQVDVGTLLISSLATVALSIAALQSLIPGSERIPTAVLLFILAGLHGGLALLVQGRGERKELPMLAGVMSLLLMMASIAFFFPKDSSGVSATWAALGVLLTAGGALLQRPQIAFVSLLPFIGSALRFVANDLSEAGTVSAAALPADLLVGLIDGAAAAAGAVITRSLRKHVSAERGGQHVPGALLVIALLILFTLAGNEFTGAVPSVLWGVLGLAVVVAGFAARWKEARLVGLTALAVTVGRVFINDLAGLEVLARVVSFMVLGGILLLLGYWYSHNRERLQKFLDEE